MRTDWRHDITIDVASKTTWHSFFRATIQSKYVICDNWNWHFACLVDFHNLRIFQCLVRIRTCMWIRSHCWWSEMNTFEKYSDSLCMLVSANHGCMFQQGKCHLPRWSIREQLPIQTNAFWWTFHSDKHLAWHKPVTQAQLDSQVKVRCSAGTSYERDKYTLLNSQIKVQCNVVTSCETGEYTLLNSQVKVWCNVTTSCETGKYTLLNSHIKVYMNVATSCEIDKYTLLNSQVKVRCNVATSYEISKSVRQ